MASETARRCLNSASGFGAGVGVGVLSHGELEEVCQQVGFDQDVLDR